MSFSNFCLPHSSAPEPSRPVCEGLPTTAAARRTPSRACRTPIGLSRSAFMARFSAAFGEPPMSLLRRVRRRHAAELLAANALSIDQVALNAGYQNRSSFTRTFRRHYGGDPSEYRARAQRTPSQAPHPPRMRSRNPMQPSLTPAVAPRERRHRRARLRRGRLAATGNRAPRLRGLDSANGPSTACQLSDQT